MVSTRLQPALSLSWVPAQRLASQMPSTPRAWPQLGLRPREGLSMVVVIALPEADGGGGQLPGDRTAGQLLHFLPEASAPHPRPAGPILLVSPHPPGWPACPAPLPGPGWALVHFSGTRRLIKPPRKQGQPARAEEGAALGHVWLQGFFGPCSNPPPRIPESGLPDRTGCEYARVCALSCVGSWVQVKREAPPSPLGLWP